MFGSYMAIGMRAVVCIIWNGTNAYYGSMCLTVAIKAIWPQYADMKNQLPASASITSQGLLSCESPPISFPPFSNFPHSLPLHDGIYCPFLRPLS